MKTIFSYLRQYYGKMTLGFIIKSAGTLSELVIPYILSHILENVIKKGIKDIIFWGIMMIICAGIACIFNIMANRMAAKVSRNFAEDLRKDLFFKTLRLSAAQTDKFTIASLESRITSDTYNVHSFINMIQRMGVRAPILLAGGIAITMFMDAKLSTVMILLLPVIFATVYFIRKKGVPLYTKIQHRVDDMVRVVREDAQGIRVIKALSKNEYEHRRYDERNKALVKQEIHANLIMGTVHPLMTILMNMGSIAVIVLGAHFVSKSSSSPETIIAFMQYFTQISMAMMAVTRMFVMYTKSSASSRRIEEVLNAKEDLTIATKEEYPDISTDTHIKFQNVSFSYNKKSNNLENISFSLKRGEHLGIIGATGSGKSTIIKLLLRFYDTDKGGIYINGENIRTIEKENLYSKIGSALQYDFLYADTIEENIKFGRDLSHEDVVAACKTAQAYDFITDFPDGFEHMLSSHGTNISGGQKQRVLISRAIAGKPEILILDDSSSALDYKTDLALRKALEETMQTTTVVTVAQRVSSVKNCDLIIVIDEGHIIGFGKHDALLQNCTEYREISESQMGGALVD